MLFRNRREAGKQLAQKLASYANREDVIVLGLPRGGVPVAYEVAHALHTPLDGLSSESSATVLLVDDGLATDSTMRAAVKALRRLSPRQVIVAVPVGSSDTCEELHQMADEVICPQTPESFRAVGHWYADFQSTSDAEVQRLLAERTAGV